MLAEIDEISEYQQATENLTGVSIEQINLKEVIEAFQSCGIYYSAVDTRKIDPANDNMATLIYRWSQPFCPSHLKFTITHNVITSLETEWRHNHTTNRLQIPSKTCSVCEKSGHNKRSCPIAKGKLHVQTLFQQKDNQQLIRLLETLDTDGWCLLGIGAQQMIHLVSLIPLDNPECVRRFFLSAPNDEQGIAGKLRLYAKIVASQDGRKPNLYRDLTCLDEARSYESLANLVYALTWYVHYAILRCSQDMTLFTVMKDRFAAHYRKPRTVPYCCASQLFMGALAEATLILEESLGSFAYVCNDALNVNQDNVISVSRSMVPNFLECVRIQGPLCHPPKKFLRGCWTVKTIFVRNNDGTAIERLLSTLRTAQIVYQTHDC